MPQLAVPKACEFHQRATVQHLGLRPTDEWQGPYVVAHLLHASRVLRRPDVQDRCGGDPTQVSVHWPTCWPCAFGAEWDLTLRLLWRFSLDDCVRMALGQLEVPDDA